MSRGFTLLETLLYFALFAVIAGGGVAAAGGIVGTAARSADRVASAEEANFLGAKIDWLLTGSDITEPATGTSNILIVQKTGVGTIGLEPAGTDAALTRGDGVPHILNASDMRVTTLEFTRDDAATLTARFTLSSTSSGPTINQDFELTFTLLP